MPKNGEAWVNGAYIHFVDGSGEEWRYEGEDIGSPPTDKEPEEIWRNPSPDYDDSPTVEYVDQSGTLRSLGADTIDNGVAETRGSIWVEETQNRSRIIYVSESSNLAEPHRDLTDHINDGTSQTSHSDSSPHADSGHSNNYHSDNDYHSDSGHSDNHADNSPHANSHLDGENHSDNYPHTDYHSDGVEWHTDNFSFYHDDFHHDGGFQPIYHHDFSGSSQDGRHSDMEAGHSDHSYNNTWHSDSTSHADTGHSNTYHSDHHDSSDHGDSHGDSYPHSNSWPHSNSHSDNYPHSDNAPHTDNHSDTESHSDNYAEKV